MTGTSTRVDMQVSDFLAFLEKGRTESAGNSSEACRS